MVAAGVLPLSHATDGGGSIRIPAGANGNIGLKPSRGVFSIAPKLSDLSGLVSTQGCHSRTVRDTAAFVDHCRGGAPGEFMPYWMPPEPYSELIQRDPPRLRIALSHEWGDYRATPHFVAELERVGRFLEGLGHHVEWALPAIDFRAAFAAQTTCYISNFAQTITDLLAPEDLQRPPAELIEPINIRIWEAGLRTSYSERAQMQAVFNTTSRAFGEFFESWDIILTPITALPTPQDRHDRIPDDQRQPVGAGLVREPVAQLRLHAAGQPVRHARASRCRWARRQRACRWASTRRRRRPTTGCCCSWPRRSSEHCRGAGTTAECPPITSPRADPAGRAGPSQGQRRQRRSPTMQGLPPAFDE